MTFDEVRHKRKNQNNQKNKKNQKFDYLII